MRPGSSASDTPLTAATPPKRLTAERQDLLDSIQHALAADRAAREQRAKAADVRRRYDYLTPREREVMHLVITGRLNKQIADQLGTSEVTIKMHRGQVMHKMHAESVVDLLRMAEAIGIKGDGLSQIKGS